MCLIIYVKWLGIYIGRLVTWRFAIVSVEISIVSSLDLADGKKASICFPQMACPWKRFATAARLVVVSWRASPWHKCLCCDFQQHLYLFCWRFIYYWAGFANHFQTKKLLLEQRSAKSLCRCSLIPSLWLWDSLIWAWPRRAIASAFIFTSVSVSVSDLTCWLLHFLAGAL